MFSKLVALFCRAILLLAVGCCVYGTVVIGFKVPVIGWGVLGILLWRRYRSWQRRGGGYAHGTARVADAADLHARGLLGPDGLILGRAAYLAGPTFAEAFRQLITLPLSRSGIAVSQALAALSGKRGGVNGIIRLRDFVHLMTCSTTGGGKGVSVLVPNLLSYIRSCVVIDPKCELYKLTSKHRERKFKHRIVRIDPFDEAKLGPDTADTFNPLDLIDPDSPFLIDEARDLASMLVIRTGKEHEPYWNNMAELFLTTFIAYVAACERTPEYRNLQTVRDLVCDREKFTKALAVIKQSDACGGMLRRLGAACACPTGDELGSILGSVKQHTSFFDSSAVAASTAASSFQPRDLRTRRMTVYLCLPADKLVSHAALQRLWIGCMLRAVTKDRQDERDPVMFFLDEVGNLGHIQALEDAVTLLRGYGVRLWFFFQSIAQIKLCFGDKAPTFLDNIATQQFFNVNSDETAELISKRMGDATIITTSEQDGTSDSRSTGTGGKGEQSGQHSRSRSFTVSEMGRKLANPDEIRRMPDDMTIIFHKNMPPIIGQSLRYYDAPEFRKGGTGRPRGQGFSALVRSLCFLGLSVAFAAFATDLPAPAASPADGGRVNPYAPFQQLYEPGPFYGGQPLPFSPPVWSPLPPGYPVNPPRMMPRWQRPQPSIQVYPDDPGTIRF